MVALNSTFYYGAYFTEQPILYFTLAFKTPCMGLLARDSSQETPRKGLLARDSSQETPCKRLWRETPCFLQGVSRKESLPLKILTLVMTTWFNRTLVMTTWFNSTLRLHSIVLLLWCIFLTEQYFTTLHLHLIVKLAFNNNCLSCSTTSINRRLAED